MMDRIYNTENIWFTADNHFGHKNIIEYTNRPFSSVEEMDGEMIKRWNSLVKPNDIVYHLGDFTLGDFEKAKLYFARLNGEIRILKNSFHHDKFWVKGYNAHFEANICKSFQGKHVELLEPIHIIELDDRPYPLAIVLCHYPLAVWDRKHYGSIHLHGHNHGRYKSPNEDDLIFDVGVDCWNYAPVSLGRILEETKRIGK